MTLAVHGAAIMAQMSPAPGRVLAATSCLTGRQVEILRFMSEGAAIDGIADQLGYSPSTIKKEVHFLLRRVGARNRTHAVAMAIRAGLI